MDPHFQDDHKKSPLLSPLHSTEFLQQAKLSSYLPSEAKERNSLITYDLSQHQTELNRLIHKGQSNHCRSLIVNLILWGGQIIVVTLYSMNVIDIPNFGFIGICLGIYVFYLFFGLCGNSLLSFLTNIEQRTQFQHQYDNIRNTQGFFTLHAQCYHYDTVSHTTTTTDADGNTQTSSYTTEQKHTTHTAKQQLHPRSCQDESGNLEDIQAETELIFLSSKVDYRFVNEESQSRFESIWAEFKQKNCSDSYQSYFHYFEVPGLRKQVTYYVGSQAQDYKSRLIFFAMLGFLWPYSIHLEEKVARYNLIYKKIVAI